MTWHLLQSGRPYGQTICGAQSTKTTRPNWLTEGFLQDTKLVCGACAAGVTEQDLEPERQPHAAMPERRNWSSLLKRLTAREEG